MISAMENKIDQVGRSGGPRVVWCRSQFAILNSYCQAKLLRDDIRPST